jgi:hypothetical protein
MATVTIDSGGSEPRRFTLLAGQDTAEWSAACVDDKTKVLHRPAPVFNRSPVPSAGASCMGQRYLADKSVDRGPASRITIDWAPEAAAKYPKTSMRIDYITAADSKGQSTVIEAGNVLSPDRWKRREFEGGLVLFENLRAMPQAWLVERAVSLGSVADEVAAIRSGLLPAKDLFDPASVLVTSDKRIPSGHLERRAEKASQASVQVAEWAGPTKKFLVESSNPRWLVVSNQHAPGWTATLDGGDTAVFRVNAVLQGVWVPAGKHIVELKYLPRHFALLLCVAALCLALVGWLLFSRRQFNFPAKAGLAADRINIQPAQADSR